MTETKETKEAKQSEQTKQPDVSLEEDDAFEEFASEGV